MYSKNSINELANALRIYLASQDAVFLNPPFLNIKKSFNAIKNLKGKLEITETPSSIPNNINDSIIETFDMQSDFTFKMIINSQNLFEMIFEIAHQIGHLFIHLNYGSNLWISGKCFTDTIISRSSINATDYEANQFASSFMMPENEYKNAFLILKDTIKLSSYFNVPEKRYNPTRKSIKIMLNNSAIPDPTKYLKATTYTTKLILFTSFDLVGSSSFKSKNVTDWPNIFFSFFERVYNEVTKFSNEAQSFKTWKLQGDEILFSIQIKSLPVIEKAISHIYSIINKVSNELPSPLNIKASSWLALIDDTINKELPKDFLGTFNRDYIGATIDEGFRITSHFSRPQSLVLSFDLVYLLMRTKAKSYLYCVGYKKLKGIWNNRFYPVFWYSENYKRDVLNKPYDEQYDCELTRSFIHDKNQPQLKQLNKIINELLIKKDFIRSEHLNKVKNYLSKSMASSL